MAVDVGSAVGYLDLDISGFLSGLKSAQSEADKQSKNIATTIGNNLSNLGNGLTSAGTTLTKNVTAPLLAISVAGFKVATDFEKGMSEVKAISGATGSDFDDLRNKAIELGADTAFSANEVAVAMTEMAKAGWDSQQIIDGMSGVLSAAAASGEQLGTVSTIVADAITGFGLEANDSSRIADLLTQAANSGTIGITDLGESFKYIAPVAGAMGLSVEDVTTAISAMSMAGIKGSQAGTSLRTMLTRMVKPTDDVAIAMDELGISVTNQDGSMKSLDDIVSNLRTSFDGLTDSEKAKYAATLAGQEGMSGMLSLLNLTEEEYNEIAKSMDNATGVAEKTAAVMQDNLQSKIEQLGGSLESLAIKLADHVIPHIQTFVEWLTALVDKFTNLNPETQKTILKFLAIAAAAGPVLAIFGKLTSGVGSIITTFGKIPGAVGKLKTGFAGLVTGLKNIGEGIKLTKAGFPALGAQASKLGAALGGITAPVIAVVAVLAVLAAAFVSLWKNNEEFRNKITAIWEEIKGTFERLTSGITERLNSLGFNFGSIGEVLKSIWQGFCNFLAPIFEGAFQAVANVFSTIVDVILGIADVFISIFKGNWEGAWNAVKGIFESVFNGISEWFQNILNTIQGALDVALGWFGTSWTECWEGIKTFFTDTINAISTGVSDFITSVSDFFTQLFTNISTFTSDAISSVTTWVSDMLAKAGEVGQGFLDKVVEFFTQVPTNIATFISTALDNVVTWVTDIGAKAIEAGTNFLSNITSHFTTLPSEMKVYLDSAIDNLVSWVTDMGAKGTEAISALITNFIDGAKGVGQKVLSIGSDIVNGVWDGISSAATSFTEKVTGFFSGIVESVCDFLGINSPSKVFKERVGRWLPLGVAEGFEDEMPTATKLIQGYLNKGIGGIKTNDVTIGAGLAVSGFVDSLKTVYGEVAVWFESIESRIGNSIDNMIRSLGMLINAGRIVVGSDGTLGYVGYNGFAKTGGSSGSANKEGSNNGVVGNGDTFIFNSPKAIDEIEAARQMKRTKQDMAEGF